MDSLSKQLSQGNVRSSSSVRLAATSTRSHRAVLRGRDGTATSLQASSLRSLWRTVRHGDASLVGQQVLQEDVQERLPPRKITTPCQVGLSPVFSPSRVAPDRLGQVTLPPAGKSARRTDGRNRSRQARRVRERTIALPPQWPRHEVERSFPSRAKRPVAAGPGGARGALPRLSRGIEFQWDSHCRNFPRRKGYRARK
jgi:hypothetical protein